MSKQRKHDQDPGSAIAELWSDIERALPAVRPGLEIVDRNLQLAADSRADLVCVDAQGRLTLVLAAGGEGETPILRALDALAFARRNRAPLAQHLGAARLCAELDACVILVASAFSRRLIERLAPLAGRDVDLYELRQLSSAAGSTRWLAPVWPTGNAGESQAPATEEGFLEALSAEQRELGLSLLCKLKRLDPELECLPGRRAIHWRFRAQPLARLESSEGRLYASAAPNFEACALAEPKDVECVLEQVMGGYVGLLDLNGSAPTEEQAAVQPRLDLRQAAGGALLTHEELEAFRQ